MKRKTVTIGLVVTMLLGLCACGKKSGFSASDFKPATPAVESTYVFAETEAEPVRYSEEKLNAFQNMLQEYHVEYGYDELFHYEKAMEGMLVDSSVASHAYSALDENGILTPEHLFGLVKENNKVYLNSATSIYQALDDKVIRPICEIIVNVITDMLKQYPEIDKDRVYCNLGNLKIVEKRSGLNYGAVQSDLVLYINRSTAQLLDVKQEASMYNVMVHEIMHILQFGCSCEQEAGCDRRCGLAYYYDDRKQQYSDLLWLGEGSAERMACLYIGTQPMTYFNHINYILTLDLVTMLKEEVPANYLETLYFFDDADALFALFDADTEEEKEELYNMLYALEIMQSEPVDVKDAYYEIYGIEWTEEVSGDVFNKVKRPIIQYATKQFYTNLAEAVKKHEVTKNDVLFMVNMYESTINQHLKLDNAKYDTYNAEFVKWYKDCRKAFLESFENVTEEEYAEFFALDDLGQINASLNWLAKEKTELLFEKCEAHGCKFILR